MWQYSPYTNSWIQISNFGGSAREGASAFVINNEAYVCCGFDNAYKYDVWKYTPGFDVGIAETKQKNVIQLVYPNPTKNELTILLYENLNDGIISICDINGKVVHTEKLSDCSEKSINIEHLEEGVYFVTIKSSNNISSTKKIIKIN